MTEKFLDFFLKPISDKCYNQIDKIVLLHCYEVSLGSRSNIPRAVVSTGATGAVALELFEELLNKNSVFGILKCPLN